MTVAISLPTLRVSDEEDRLLRYHLDRLSAFRVRNDLKAAYYEGRQRVQMLGIAIPPSLQRIEAVVGWPATVVDVLEERLDFLGWSSETRGGALGLEDVYAANELDVDAGLAHLDALIHGVSFVIVGAGDHGEPSPLVTVESPLRVTGAYDGRVRRLTSALSVDRVSDAGEAEELTLYLPHESVRLSRSTGRGWAVADRDEHRLGRVPVVPLVNRPRASRADGRSEITRAVRSYTDQAVRTLLGMDVNREFYSAPQRYVMGADEEAFQDGDGNVRTGWEMVMGRILALPRDEDGEVPNVGEFKAASPAPYLAQVEGLSQLLAAEGSIPPEYLGFTSVKASSADAIRAAEARLVKRAERRQTTFGRAWREVGALALLVRDGAVPESYRSVGLDWRDAATPTRAAAADEAVKLVAAGILPADSPVTYKRLGFSPAEQKQIEADKRRERSTTRLQALAQAAAPEPVEEAAPNGSVQS